MSYIGTNKVGKMYLGDTAIGKAYLGEDLVYNSASAIPVTATPTISYVESATDVVITATGNGTVVLMIDGIIVTNPYTISKTSSVQNITATATAQETGKAISETATLAISIPAEVPKYIGDWQDGYKLGASGKSFVEDANFVLSPYYLVNPKDGIKFYVGGPAILSISELPSGFTSISQSIDYWNSQAGARSITLSSRTYYIILALKKANMAVSYVLNTTTGEYIYKGDNVS